MLVFQSIFGACGGSPPSVFKRDPSNRILEASPKARSSASSLSPRGSPVSTILHLLKSTARHHIIFLVGGGVSFLMSCPGSPPTPRGATCLHLGGGTSSGVPRDPLRRSPQSITSLTTIKILTLLVVLDVI